MVKQFILLLQLIGVFIYQLILTGDVTVTQVVPLSIPTNTETLIEINVVKGNVSGFAKVQQDIPAGFTIDPVETRGATFSFKDNRVKFIWMALPSEEEFTISYNIKPIEGTVGEFSLGGKFSFIADSERKNIPMNEAKFSVTEEVLADETTETTDTNEETSTEEIDETSEETASSNEETDAVATIEEEETTTEEETTVVEEKVTISSNRAITNNGDGSYNVKLIINKKGIEGFAKVTEQLPSGFVAEEVNSNGGVFSFKENTAKFLWMAIPKDEELVVEYLLKKSDAANGNHTISGAFAYLENDITQGHTIDASNFELNIEEEVLVDETTETEESIDTPEETEETTIEEEVADNTTETTEETEETETSLQDKVDEQVGETSTTDAITSVPAPETGVSYKVQVGAGHQTVSSNWFATKFNLTDEVNTENHEGWIKYVVGSFNEYKAARDKRNVVRNKVKRAFVTAYNSGSRITVQEALMISKQKWYK